MTDIPPSNPSTPTRFSPTLLVLALIPLLGIAAAIGILLADRAANSVVTTESAPARVGSIGQIVPEFTVSSLDGQPVDLAQFRGRPVFVNFWGTWCPPCVRELPELQAFAAAQGDTGAVVLASNNTETPEVIYQYFEDNGLDLPDIQFVQDAESALYRWFGVFQMPTTYLVSAEGEVFSVKYGPFDIAGMQSYLDALAAADQGG